MNSKRCYLFALEVQPLEVGDIHQTLPLHCTLMHRFWSELPPEALAEKATSYFATFSPIKLIPREYLLLGPKQVPVAELELTEQIKSLHMGLYGLLNDLHVEYTVPEWVGEGYRSHVTEKDNARLEVGSTHMSNAVYLIEVEVPEHPNARLIRHRFEFTAQPS